MIKAFTGVPGSGKSLHAIKVICTWLKDGLNVIANFPIKIYQVKKNEGRYFYVPNELITVDYLMQFSQTVHEYEGEGQTLIVIDEAAVKFNSRTFLDEDRLGFLSFFAQHRHYGYEVILICQTLKQIDKQIRELTEIEVHHRKANNFWVYKWVPFTLFIAVERNLAIHAKNDSYYFTYSKYYGGLYDTFFEFDRKIVPEYSEALQNMILKSELLEDVPPGIPGAEVGRLVDGGLVGAPHRQTTPQADMVHAQVDYLFTDDDLEDILDIFED